MFKNYPKIYRIYKLQVMECLNHQSLGPVLKLKIWSYFKTLYGIFEKRFHHQNHLHQVFYHQMANLNHTSSFLKDL